MRLQIRALLVLLTISSTTVAANFSVSGLNGSGCENLSGSRACVTMLLAGDIEEGDAARLVDFIEATSNVLSSSLKQPVRVGQIYPLFLGFQEGNLMILHLRTGGY